MQVVKIIAWIDQAEFDTLGQPALSPVTNRHEAETATTADTPAVRIYTAATTPASYITAEAIVQAVVDAPVSIRRLKADIIGAGCA